MSLPTASWIGSQVGQSLASSFHSDHSKCLHATFLQDFCNQERESHTSTSSDSSMSDFENLEFHYRNEGLYDPPPLCSHCYYKKHKERSSIQYNIPLMSSKYFQSHKRSYSFHCLDHKKMSVWHKYQNHSQHNLNSVYCKKASSADMVATGEPGNIFSKKKIASDMMGSQWKYATVNKNMQFAKLRQKHLYLKENDKIGRTYLKEKNWKLRGTSWPSKEQKKSFEQKCGLFLVLQFVMIILFVFQIVVLLKSLITGKY